MMVFTLSPLGVGPVCVGLVGLLAGVGFCGAPLLPSPFPSLPLLSPCSACLPVPTLMVAIVLLRVDLYISELCAFVNISVHL